MSDGLSRLVAIAGMLIACAIIPAQALAQDVLEPGERSYNVSSASRAALDKPPEQIAREQEQARAYSLACDEGLSSACSDLGQAYELGEGVAQVRPIAGLLYAQACDGQDAEGCRRLGLLTGQRTDEDAATEAAQLLDRACQIGSLAGCAEFAVALDTGDGLDLDRSRAEALLRETCARGGGLACRELALILKAEGRGGSDRFEAFKLLDEQCRLADLSSCLEILRAVRAEPQSFYSTEIDYLGLACTSGDAQSCSELGRSAFTGDAMPIDVDYAYRAYDRACALSKGYCDVPQSMRAEPVRYQECIAGGMEACAALGEIYEISGTPLFDLAKARIYFERACFGGAAEACVSAADRIFFDTDEMTDADLVLARAYLESGCAAGHDLACNTLARELDAGKRFSEDKPRAYGLYAALCEKDWDGACLFLERRAASDPDAPLIEASSRYVPPDNAEDIEEPVPNLSEEERELLASNCFKSTAEFRGKVYSDIICPPALATINGFAMRRGQIPWQAMLWRPERLDGRDIAQAQRMLCGGSIIRSGWILTAAHCLIDPSFPDQLIFNRGYRIRLGVYNPLANEGVSYPITGMYMHPQFNKNNFAYDIALVRYDTGQGTRGDDKPPIASIRLDQQNVNLSSDVEGRTVYAYGWGWTAATRSQSTDYLQGVRMQLVAPARCTEITGFRRSRLHAALCAGGPNGEQTCQGDSGGPLVYYGDGRPTIIGVVSAGRKCGTLGEPSRYTRVGKVRSWIDQTIAARN